MVAIILDSLRHAGFKLQVLILVTAVILGALAVFFWSLAFQKKHRRKRKHRGHGRIKPTLAQVGGLSPVRRGDETNPGNPPPNPS